MLIRKILLCLIVIQTLSIQNFPQAFEPNVLAIVGEHKIYVDEFSDRYSNYLFATGMKDNLFVRESILNGVISELLLTYYDDNSNIISNDEYKKEINWVSKQSSLAYLKDQEIYAKISVSDDELRNTFIKVNENLSASHLYAQTLGEAEYLHNLLQMGVDWDNLAAQVFTDSTLRNNGGYLGYFTWGDMDPAFEETAYSLKVGEISKPVKTKNGYSIIRLEGRTPHPLLTEYEFQNKKNKLEQVLKLKKKVEYEKNYTDSIFDKSKYSLNQQSLDNISGYLQLSDIEKNESVVKISDETVTVNYGDLTLSEKFIVEQLKQIPEYHRARINTSEVLKTVIQGITMQQLLYAEVVKKEYDKVPAVVKESEKNKKAVFLKYKMKAILSDVQVSDSSLKVFYENNLSSFKYPSEVSIQEIIIDNKLKADSIYELIVREEDFGKMAKAYSLRKASAQNDGVIEYSELSKFGSVKKMFWQSEVGKVIGPLEVYGYYGIFKVLGKREGKQKLFEDVKENVLSLYKFENKKILLENYLDKIKKRVKISINNNVLSSIKFLEKDIN